MHETDILIIGGGPAGITFARRLRKLQPETRITMFRPEEHSMVYCAIPYAIEGLFEAGKVFKSDTLVTEAGVDLVRRTVVEADLKARRVVDEEGEVYTAEVLFLATGASPVRPPIPGADAGNVHTVKTQRDMEGLIQGVSIDSRTIRQGECFFAVKGDTFDGHDFLEEARQKNAACVVVQKHPPADV